MNQFVEKYGQILLPLITPFDEKEEVNYETYAELIKYLEKNDGYKYYKEGDEVDLYIDYQDIMQF